ncbi:flagellar hook-associated protein FlgK [Telmatospirillum sp. J64-1]|uniref:flagellar hook-associated protein FlgK n=1 Tax=Telmatospirillum sp. J64-1 TaxID=2502183 RepID=UPI00115DC430|nr:flagellar hook-associated protein FlgK [Telmatospirillum sp. J64-1]
MTLMSALSSALSGLQANQAKIDVISRNVSNASTPGYTRKYAPTENAIYGTHGGGVRLLAVQRQVDNRMQLEMFAQSGQASQHNVISDFLSRVDQLFGRPQDAVSVSASVKNLTNSLQALADTPEMAALRQGVLNDAQNLAMDLNNMSQSIQKMRLEAEQGIAASVKTINNALHNIDRLNNMIAQATIKGQSTADLEDQRDIYMGQISAEMGVRFAQAENNRVVVFTETGRVLLDGAVNELAFRPASNVTAASNSENGLLGQIILTSTGEDLVATNAIRSGNLGGYLALRDEILPEAQRQLDELAHALATSLAADYHAVNADGSATLDFTKMGFTGDEVVVEYRDASGKTQQTVVTFSSDDDTTNRADLLAALGPGFSFSGDTLVPPAGSTISSVRSFSETAGSGIELFVDGDGNGGSTSYRGFTDENWDGVPSGADQKTGFAGRITVNPALLSNPAKLVTPLDGSTGQSEGRPLELARRLSQTEFDFAGNTGIGGVDGIYRGTIENFAANIVSYQAVQTAGAQERATYENRYHDTLSERFQSSTGVNIDDELAQLILVQTAYGASSKIIQSIQAMMDELMQMTR